MKVFKTHVAQFPWVESIVGDDGLECQMWCKIFSHLNGKGKMLVLKLDTPYKHVFCQKKTILALSKLEVGEHFYNKHVMQC
jgi:hypothetical protein